ncbi:MAG: serine hydrolase [Sporocytophaga sp.]|uniref:serine hydrolase n=1 Tax=Sporocytophaga sp. TaxID=2231183 RepID=UPI001B2825E5|nr:serine hydrolase [Sporocytophaga sp.]MBO9700612.1 serine hydrolase [Sporocytophaga sp.]
MKTRSKFFNRLLTAYAASVLLPGTLFAQAWIAKHGMSPAEYQTAFNTNTANGYRLTSVNGYTSNGAEKYIALWEKVSGGAYVTSHSMTAAEYQTAFNTYTSQGYRPTLISGYAVGGVAQFAAIWEKKSGGAWIARHNLTAAQYQAVYDTYTAQGYRPTYISGYVVNGVEYFAGIWEVVSGGGAWVARHNLTAAQYQSAFNTYNSQGYILKRISGYNKGGTDLYAAVWEKTSSPMWSARHGITSANYQYVFDNHYYSGYRPVLLNAFASGTSSKFNGFWTNTNISSANMAKIDNAVNGFLSSQSVPGLSLAIVKDGRLVFAKGYGYANSSTGEEMSPDQPGRIMSISKPVTSVGIMTLIQKGLLSKESFVFGANGVLSQYTVPANKPSLKRIRVRHLLNHTSGLRSCNGESVFWDDTKTADDAMAVLLAANDLVLTDTSVAFEYSNTNYFILGRIIEKVSGLKYEDYIRQNVLNKCGIGSTMYVGQASGNAKAGEMNYTPFTDMNLQLWGAFGGWVARPIDLLKFLNRVDGAATPSDILTSASHTTMTTGSSLRPSYAFGWGVSGSSQGHNGCHGSSRSNLTELGGGVSYAVIINGQPSTDDCGEVLIPAIEAGLKQVTAYPSYNLFDNIGTGARADEFAITAEEQGFNINMDASSLNKVLAYPTVSTDGVINFSNASDITSVTVSDMLGNRETYKAVERIQTQLKGMLILQIETENGKVTQKVIVE